MTDAPSPPPPGRTADRRPPSAPRLRTPRKHVPGRPRRSLLLTVLTGLVLLYSLVPLVWLVINATKTQEGLFDSFGLWFSRRLRAVGQHPPARSPTTTASSSAGCSTPCCTSWSAPAARPLLAVLGGYALAKFDFPGKRAVFAVVIGAVAVPGTALAVPTFLMFSKMGLTNTPWAVIIPSLISPFGLYLMWTFAAEAIPDRTARGRADRRRRRVPHVLPDRPAAAGAGHRDRAAVHHGRDLEQLLPAADHAQGPGLVPADPGPERVERPGRRRPAGEASSTW